MIFKILIGFSELLFYSQGMIVPLSRCIEPYFSSVFVGYLIQIFRFFTCKKHVDSQIEQKDEEIGPLFMFMNSGLFVELVYVILEGITTQLLDEKNGVR